MTQRRSRLLGRVFILLTTAIVCPRSPQTALAQAPLPASVDNGNGLNRGAGTSAPHAGAAARFSTDTISPAVPERNAAAGRVTLDSVWHSALSSNKALQAKDWQAISAEHGTQAFRSQRLPNVGVETTYTMLSDTPSFRFGATVMPLPTETFPYAQQASLAAKGRVTLPLYTSGRISNEVDAATARVSAAKFDAYDARLSLKLRVAEEYVQVLRTRRDVEVCRDVLKSLESHATLIEQRLAAQQVAETDQLAANVAVAEARQQLIQAETREAMAISAVNRRLERPLHSPLELEEVALGFITDDVESLTARALGSHPSLARRTATGRALEYQAESVRNRNGPQVELRGEYGYEENRYVSPEAIAGIGVGVTWSLFDGGRNRHEAQALSCEAESVRREQQELAAAIALTVHQAWLEMNETKQRLALTPAGMRQADENLRVAKLRYGTGMATHLEVLDAEAARARAYRNHYQAACDAVVAILRLRYAIATL